MSHEANGCVLALDQGTTSSRAIVFDRGGSAVASASLEFRQHYPRPGWVEHDPEEIWQTQRLTAEQALSESGLHARSVVALGITNQRETVVVWDRTTGVPVHPAIVWQDRRTADDCAALKSAGHEATFARKAGLTLDPYFSGTKLRWILDNVAGCRRRAEAGELAFGTIDTWLAWKLTSGRVHVTDPSNASRTLLFDIHRGDWDDELLGILDIPRALLPEVRGSSEVFGEVDPGALPALGGVPLAGMAGDQQAALFGQACFDAGMAKNTYGTGCFLLLNTGTEPVVSGNALLTTVAWKVGGVTEYALEGSVFMAGAAVKWLRDEMRMIECARECDELAETVEDAGGLYIVPAFAGLGAPHWDPYARGTAIGITRGTGRAHFARAVLESIAFQCADLIDCMERDSGLGIRQLRVDGGVSNSAPMLRFQADLLGVPVQRSQTVETTALGAAYLAGLAVGHWRDREEIAGHWNEGARFEPSRPRHEMEPLREGWSRALERAKGWAR